MLRADRIAAVHLWPLCYASRASACQGRFALSIYKEAQHLVTEQLYELHISHVPGSLFGIVSPPMAATVVVARIRFSKKVQQIYDLTLLRHWLFFSISMATGGGGITRLTLNAQSD